MISYQDLEDRIASLERTIRNIGIGQELIVGDLHVLNRITATGSEAASSVGTAGITFLLNKRSASPATHIGGIYATAAELGLTATDAIPSSETDTPVAALVGHIENSSTTSDALAILGHGEALGDGTAVWGAHLIARQGSGAANSKLIGLEINVMPRSGGTASALSTGLSVLAIHDADELGPGISVDMAVGAGRFANGVVVGDVVGAAFCTEASSGEMTTGLNLCGGSFSEAAIKIGNGDLIVGLNAAGDGNVEIARIGGSNELFLGVNAPGAIVLGYSGTDDNPVHVRVGGVDSKQMVVGAEDSGGEGYRMLRVSN